GELRGGTKRSQSVDTGFNQVRCELSEHTCENAAMRIDGRDEVGKDAVEIAHILPKKSTAPLTGIRHSARPVPAGPMHKRAQSGSRGQARVPIARRDTSAP